MIKLDFIDDLDFKMVEYVEYLINYLNVDLTQIEIELLINTKIKLSESKEIEIYNLSKSKSIEHFKENDFEFVKEYPIYFLPSIIYRMTNFIYDELNKKKSVFDEEHIDSILLKLIKYYDKTYINDPEIFDIYKKFYKHVNRFINNINHIIVHDKIIINKFTFHPFIVVLNNRNYKHKVIEDEIILYYKFTGFRYRDLINIIYSYKRLILRTDGVNIQSIEFNYSNLNIKVTYDIDYNRLQDYELS